MVSVLEAVALGVEEEERISLMWHIKRIAMRLKTPIIIGAALIAMASVGYRTNHLAAYPGHNEGSSSEVLTDERGGLHPGRAIKIKSADFETNNNYQVNGRLDKDSKSRKTTHLYSVEEGQKFYYTLRTYESSYMIIAFDKGGKILPSASVAGNNDAFLRSGYYTVPKGVSYLAFSYSTDYNTAYYVEVREVETEESTLQISRQIVKSKISEPGNDFVGFPTSFVKDGVIFVVYKRTKSHGVTPGKNYSPVYKFSTDGGLTWSKEKSMKMPQSDSKGLYREYLPYIRFVDGKIYAVFNISVSNAKTGLIRRTAFAELSVKGKRIRVGKLQFFPNSLMNGSLAFCKSDQEAVDRASSLMCGGNFAVECNTMYVPIYTPLGTSICEWDMTKPISESSFVKKVSLNSDVGNELTEAAIVKVKKGWLMVLRNEHHKSPMYIASDDFNTVSYAGEMPFEFNNPEFKPISEDCAILVARARNSGKHGYIAVLNGEGKIIRESFYDEEPMELSDCCSGSVEIIDGKIHVFYYAAASGNLNGIKQAVFNQELLLMP